MHLKDQGGTLGLLVSTQLELFTPLQCQLCLRLADGALQSKHNLLGSLCLLVENRFCLTSVTGLFAIITTLSLCKEGSLSSLVLGDFVLGVLLASLALAVGAASFWYVNHFEYLRAFVVGR